MSEKGKCILSYLLGWVAGLIVLFAVKDNTRDTKFHAAQSIVLSLGYSIIVGIYFVIPVVIPLFSTALRIIYIMAIIMGISKVNKEENPELPVVGGLAKSIFGKKIEEE